MRLSLAWWSAVPALGACGGLIGLTDVPDTSAADAGPEETTDGTTATSDE